MNKTLSRLAIALAIAPAAHAQEAPQAMLVQPTPGASRILYANDDVPEPFANLIVNDERDIADLTPTLALVGTEQLDYLRKTRGDNEGTTLYIFKQRIGNIFTMNFVEFEVDDETRRITHISGRLDRDPGKREPLMPAGRAHALVLADFKGRAGRDFKGKYAARRHLENGDVWWSIGLENMRKAHEPLTYTWYKVSPSGEVSPVAISITVKVSVVGACNGASLPSKYPCGALPATETQPAQPAFPTVINQVGDCKQATCGPEYTVPYATVTKVEGMWEDLYMKTNCCNLGAVNREGGRDVEINVGGGDVAADGFYHASIDSAGAKRAGIVLQPGNAHLPAVTAHEAGHGLHARMNFETFDMLKDAGGIAKANVEFRAVEEAVAGINEVLFSNYNGGGQWDNPPKWTVIDDGGKDYSQQTDISQVSSLKTDYENARVGGHAVHELAKRVGLPEAAKIFVRSIEELRDTNGNRKISFTEMREAMITAAVLLGLPAASVDAIKDAWADVGVGVAATVPQPPTNTPPPGAPTLIPSMSLAFTTCDTGWTGYSLSYTPVPNASRYEVWHSFGTGYQFTGVAENNPSWFYANTNAYVRIRACNGYGCGVLSLPPDYAAYRCAVE